MKSAPSSGPAPVLRDSFALAAWLLGRLANHPHPLAQRISALSLEVYESAVLAWRDRRRMDQLERADEALVALKAHLRLAQELDLLSPAQVLHALELAERVGKQIGGWLRELSAL